VDDPTLNKALEVMDEELEKIARVFIDWTVPVTQDVHIDNIPVLDEDDMVSDSDTNVATQQSIKAYVDGLVVAQNEFKELIDTPASYVDQGGKAVRVKGAEDGLEFYTPVGTDEKVKVGAAGVADYLNENYFERDVSNHIRIKQNTLLTGVDADKVDGEEASAIVTDARVKAHFPDTLANILSDHNLAAHTALGLFDEHSDVDHNQTTNYAANQHVVLPGTVANVLSNHNLAIHNALGITTLGTVGTGVWQGTAIGWTYVSKTGSNLTDLVTRLHSSLQSIGVDDHHDQAHILDGADHSISGKTPGHFLKALTATTFGFAAHGLTYSDVGAAASSHNHVRSNITDFWSEAFWANIPDKPSSFTPSAHNLLSAYHGDTLAASPVAGDILYGNATPKWARLAKGADGKVLTLVSGYPAWATPGGGTPDPHAASHHVGGGDLVNHDSLTGFVAAEHKSLPNTIAQVLSDHNLAIHNALAIDHGSLGGKGDDDHTQYYNSTRHTKAIHDALGILHSSLGGRTTDDHHSMVHSHSLPGHTLGFHSDFGSYLNQAVKTTSAPTFDDLTLTGNIAKTGTLSIVATDGRIHCNGTNFVAISCYTQTTTGALNLNVSSSGYIKRKSSSLRYKGNIKNLELDSSLIHKLRPISFNSKCAGDDKGRRRHGLVSEEIEQVLPEIVEYGPGGQVEGYDSDMLAALILAETQRHEARIADLEAKLNN